MQLNYDNIIFIHRYDMNIPIEETCKQWNYLIEKMDYIFIEELMNGLVF